MPSMKKVAMILLPLVAVLRTAHGHVCGDERTIAMQPISSSSCLQDYSCQTSVFDQGIDQLISQEFMILVDGSSAEMTAFWTSMYGVRKLRGTGGINNNDNGKNDDKNNNNNNVRKLMSCASCKSKFSTSYCIMFNHCPGRRRELLFRNSYWTWPTTTTWTMPTMMTWPTPTTNAALAAFTDDPDFDASLDDPCWQDKPVDVNTSFKEVMQVKVGNAKEDDVVYTVQVYTCNCS